MKTSRTINLLFIQLIAIIVFSLPINAQSPTNVYKPINDDAAVYKGISSFNFFFFSSGVSSENTDKATCLIQKELEKFGKVVLESMNIQDPTKGKSDPNSSFNSPSLIFSVETIKDLQGNSLPFVLISLEYRDMVSIDKNKVQTQSCLWSRYLFAKKKCSDLEIIKESLPTLMKELEISYSDANNLKNHKKTFFFIQP